MPNVKIGFKNGKEITFENVTEESIPELEQALSGKGEVRTKAADIFKLGKASIRVSDISYILP